MTILSSVGWIGVGKMGHPMRNHVLRAAIAAGASPGQSLAELSARCSVIVLTIPDDAILRVILLGDEGLLRCLKAGQTLVEMSTVSPQVSAEIAGAPAKVGVNYLRAPVSGKYGDRHCGQADCTGVRPARQF